MKKKRMCSRPRAVFLSVVAFWFGRLSLSHHDAPRRAGVPKWSRVHNRMIVHKSQPMDNNKKTSRAKPPHPATAGTPEIVNGHCACL
jgi:hypothetical protein